MYNNYWQILISQKFGSFYCNVLGIIDNILDSITEFFFVYNPELLTNKI